jgi:enamine deaminase RidA (YjgF/YER057c/UK114 family)
VGEIEAKLNRMGLALPAAQAPLAKYVPAKLVGDLVYCSGQVPIQGGALLHTGKLGAGVTVEEGYQCARLCALNALAAIKAAAGDLDRVAEVVQVRGYVNSAPEFAQQPEVVNGASELVVEVFGEAGRHTRVAVGAAALPRNAPVEVDMVVRVR